VVEKHELEAILAKVSPEAALAIRLPSRVRRIRTHYVDRERVVMGVISQLEKTAANG
jgi:hypothetical protein